MRERRGEGNLSEKGEMGGTSGELGGHLGTVVWKQRPLPKATPPPQVPGTH